MVRNNKSLCKYAFLAINCVFTSSLVSAWINLLVSGTNYQYILATIGGKTLRFVAITAPNISLKLKIPLAKFGEREVDGEMFFPSN